ncbi:MAG: PIG-L family deacetylase [Candidatus Bathyarchaeota archaeon]|nr:PIG-L family deacetylase [Candidatus Bathyarchaeota archaeon]
MSGGILAIFAHPDDETFGCGGTLALHAEAGHSVGALSLTCSDEERGPELRRAAEALGIEEPIIFPEESIDLASELIRRVSDVIVDRRPGVVITHLPFDYHREHRVAYELVKEAVEWAGHTTIYGDAWVVERLLLMEVNTLIPSPHVVVDVSDVWPRKEAAIEAYASQLAKFQWGYYQDFMEKKAELRGAQGGCGYAEAFLVEPLAENSPFFPEKATRSLF